MFIIIMIVLTINSINHHNENANGITIKLVQVRTSTSRAVSAQSDSKSTNQNSGLTGFTSSAKGQVAEHVIACQILKIKTATISKSKLQLDNILLFRRRKEEVDLQVQ